MDTVPVDERGTTLIRPRAVTRIAEVAARQAPGAAGQGAVLGRGLPKATAQVAAGHVRLAVDVAAGWGNVVEAVAPAVRTRVAGQVAAMTGLVVDAVDVRIAAVRADLEPDPATAADAASTAGLWAVAKSPAKLPASVLAAGILVALLAGAAGVAGARDGLQAAGLVDGRSWSAWLAGRLEVLAPAGWMTPAGIAAAVVGLLVLVIAVKPRRRREIAVGDDADAWLRRRDVARLAADTAATVGSVMSVSARTRRRGVKVAVRTTGDTARVVSEVEQAVGERLTALRPVPRIRGTARAEGE